MSDVPGVGLSGRAGGTEPARWDDLPARPQIERGRVVRQDSRNLPRLTKAERLRRRRLTVLVAAALLVLGVGAAAETLVKDSAAQGRIQVRPLSSVEDGAYVVQPGDTIWSIARRLSPDADPRPLVAELRDRHGGDAALQVGDRLDLGDLL